MREASGEMKYRRLGRTEMRVSVVSLGTWQFGGEWGHSFTASEVDHIIGRAQELGINLVDTAECYGDHMSEALVGQALVGRRQAWHVATKFGHRYGGHMKRHILFSADEVRSQLEDSLAALRTDTIDLYQFHSGTDDQFDDDALWTMLDKQVEAGKVRHLGVSVSSKRDPMHQIQRARAVGASVIQIVYNRIERGPESRSLPACQEHDLGVLARVPLASGLLTGKYRPGETFTTADDLRSEFPADEVQKQLREVQHIAETEVPPGVPMAAWALGWCLQHPAVTCVIPGCKDVTQLELNASAARLVDASHPQAVH